MEITIQIGQPTTPEIPLGLFTFQDRLGENT